MKRVLAVIIVAVMSLMFVPSMAEGVQTEAYVKVTTCTLRNEPKDDTSAANRMAKMENGYTMTVVGESDGYYVILPSSVCDRAGNSLGLSDDSYGFVKKGHIRLGAKQFVVLTEKAILYDDRIESEETEIGELSAGQEVLLIKAEQSWDASIWYKVQLHDNSAGLAYMPARFGYIKDSNQQFVADESSKQPEVEAQQETASEEAENYVFEPEIDEEDWSQEEFEPQQDEQKFAFDGGETLFVMSNNLEVYSDVNRTMLLGRLKENSEVQAIRQEGAYTVIAFSYCGVLVEGYVLSQFLTSGHG